jgi:hypothetical protein
VLLSRLRAVFTGSGDAQRVKVLQTTGNLFRVLGARPLVGRTFTDEETFDGRQCVLWRSLFAGDPAIVGRTITLSGRPYEVDGVMPASFFYPSRDIELWVPVGYAPEIFTRARRPHWLRTVARLKPGVSIEQAREDMNRVASELERTFPDTNTKMGVRIEGLHDAFAHESRPALLILFAAVAARFLIVCVNVAGLQIGRAAGRAREMGTRRARYPDNAKILAAAEEIERRLSTEPGVAAVGATVRHARVSPRARRAPARRPVAERVRWRHLAQGDARQRGARDAVFPRPGRARQTHLVTAGQSTNRTGSRSSASSPTSSRTAWTNRCSRKSTSRSRSSRRTP